ncbi:cytochrome P450 [Infundibulicybe gibba]|nr:cytochrome P450 [Infundibulicybe gibba]
MDQLNLSQPFLTLFKAVIAALVLRFLAVTLRRPKYLPGPRGLPFFGNLFQIPNAHSWETYAKWRETYGDAIYVSALGNSIVVLNSYEACVDLLEKRSNLYSDRPVSVVASQLMGWQRSVTLAPYTDRWRRQEREIRRFLGLLIAEPDPERCLHNFRFAAGRNLLMSLYGIDVKKADDPIITIAEEAIQYATYATTPGPSWSTSSRFYLPSWFPGVAFKNFAKKGRAIADEMTYLPFNKTKADMKTGDCEPSFTSINLEAGEDEDITVATVHAFLLAMVLYPDAQRRAQEELDTYVGTGRLPIIDDREDLPYVNAVMKEVMRWQPVAPVALPHKSTDDDIYKGCFIPAGSTILGNTWAITRDSTLYPDPERFNPDRFLPLFDKSIKCDALPLDPVNYAFGFGRRICSGMDYADTMLFLSMASILSAFDVRPAKDEAGRDILPELKFNTNILREARPFKFSITPRPHAASVISAAQADL